MAPWAWFCGGHSPEGCDAFNRKPLQTNQPFQTLLEQSCSQILESPLSGQERSNLLSWVRLRKGSLYKWTAGEDLAALLQGLLPCGPRLPMWMTGQGGEEGREAFTMSLGMGGTGGRGRNRKVQGVGPGPCGRERRGRKLASPSFLLSEPLLKLSIL